MPKRTMFRKAWSIACACTSPPGVPNAIKGRPLRSARAGLGVRRGRRPGATQEAWSGSVHDCEPREEGHRPVPGTTGVSAEVSLGVAEKTLPCRSTTQTYEVSSPGGPPLRDSALAPWRVAKAVKL